MEDSEESKSILQIKKSIITKLDIDNKNIKDFDSLFNYYLEKYNIEYLYFCYNNQSLLTNEILLYLSRYVKHYFLNHYNEIPLYSKEINNLKFYIQFIINNYFEDKVILKNDKCNLFINTGKLNNTKDQSFYNFTEKLFFKEDIIKPIHV